MGMFPYTCEVCGGAESKCGKGGVYCSDCGYHEEDGHGKDGHESGCKGSFEKCEGGQFCYQDSVVILVIDTGKVKHGFYDEYGGVDVYNDPVKYIPIEFERYFRC